MRDGSIKTYTSVRKPRKVIDCMFDNEAGKLDFESKFETLKKATGLKLASDVIKHVVDFYLTTFNQEHINTESQKENIIPHSYEQKYSDKSASEDEEYFICTKEKIAT